jgi:hypothetical protein
MRAIPRRNMAVTEQELRAKLYEVESRLDEARAESDPVRIAELIPACNELVDALRALLPDDAELGTQQNPHKRVDMIDVDQIPVPIVGPGGGVP